MRQVDTTGRTPACTVYTQTSSGGLRYFGPQAEINCGPNCRTIKTKNTFNQNYILNQINQFMLLYKDMNIEHKNDTQKPGNDKRMKNMF